MFQCTGCAGEVGPTNEFVEEMLSRGSFNCRTFHQSPVNIKMAKMPQARIISGFQHLKTTSSAPARTTIFRMTKAFRLIASTGIHKGDREYPVVIRCP